MYLKRKRHKHMKILYTAEATVHGGRQGEARSSDGNLVVKLNPPKEMGGSGEGTNPEQLFAVGYAACFQSALMRVAQRENVDASQSSITAKVGIGPNGQGGFGLEVELSVSIPGVDATTGQKLLELAHEVCPYSNATRGNIPVKLTFEENALAL
jgi:osmotically inducible protein OsmC